MEKFDEEEFMFRLKKEYPDINIKLKKSGGIFHDRYIIIDYRTEN